MINIKTVSLLFIFHFINHFSSFGQWEKYPIPGVISDASVGIVNLGSYLVWAGQNSTSIYISADYGKTWQPTSILPATRRDVTANLTTIFVASDNGLFISADTGKTWIQEPTIGAKAVSKVNICKSIIIAGTPSNGLFFSSNGIDWVNRYPTEKIISFDFESNFYALTESGFYKSNHPESEWVLQNDTIQNTALNYTKGINGIIFLNTYSKGIFKSVDQGKTWLPSSNGFTPKVFYEINSSRITEMANTSTDIFACTYGEGIFMSRDGGNQWFPINFGIDPAAVDNNSPGVFFSLKTIGDFIYGGTYKDNVIYRRKLSDFDTLLYAGNGLLISPNFQSATYEWFLNEEVIPNSTSYFLRAVENGVYKVIITLSLPENNLRITEETSYTYTYTITDLVLSSIEQPAIESLISISPNPAKEFLTITSEQDIVCTSFFISDLSGRVLLNKQLYKNDNTYLFDISTLSKGLYLLNLTTSEGSITKKIVIE